MIPGGQNKMSAAIKFVESHRAGALFLIVVLGFALRIHGIAGTGFNEDEIFKLQASRAYLRGDFRPFGSPRRAGESVRDGFGESRRTQYARQSSGEHVIS